MSSSPVIVSPLAALAAALIEVFEGCALKAYRDSGGVWTIGIGHTKSVHESMTCTREQALAWFAEDQAPLLARVRDEQPLRGAAFVSFGFNCGAGGLRELLDGKIQFSDRVRDRHGIVQPGLIARRNLEALLAQYEQSV